MVIPKTVGRMGNFLFQAAAALSYGWKHSIPVTLPNTTRDPVNNPIYLPHLVRTDFNAGLPCIEVREQTFSHQPIPFQEEWRKGNIILNGYWQSEKYFAEYREEILAAFNFPWSPRYGVVSVHVRRGDYLQLTQKHPPVPKEWIEKAMASFPVGSLFQFFSDDLPWCRQEFGKRGNVIFSTAKNEVEDLISMSACTHHICSASTFSWWGAWLNQNPRKRVIMPKLWFVAGHRYWDQTFDLVPPSWERI